MTVLLTWLSVGLLEGEGAAADSGGGFTMAGWWWFMLGRFRSKSKVVAAMRTGNGMGRSYFIQRRPRWRRIFLINFPSILTLDLPLHQTIRRTMMIMATILLVYFFHHRHNKRRGGDKGIRYNPFAVTWIFSVVCIYQLLPHHPCCHSHHGNINVILASIYATSLPLHLWCPPPHLWLFQPNIRLEYASPAGVCHQVHL